MTEPVVAVEQRRPRTEAGPATSSARGVLTVVVIGALAATVAVVGVSTTGAAAPSVFGDPGVLTRWGLPVARAVTVVAGALTVGLLVVVAAVLPRSRGARRGDELGPTLLAGATWASVAGGVWVVASVVVIVLTFSDVAGLPVAGMGAPGTGAGLVSLVWDVDAGRALLLSALLASSAAVVAGLATRLTTVAVAAVLAVAALLPPAVTGHATSASNHEIAVDSQVVHVVALSLWLGGLAAIVLLRHRMGDLLPVAVRRFSRIALSAYVAVGVSGVVAALLRIDAIVDLTTAYGLLLVAKAAAMLTLGVAGWYHRRRLLARLDAEESSRGIFWRLVSGELVVLAAATGFGVALARTAPPGTSADTDLTTELLGYPMPPPLDAARWFDTWRLDTVWAPVAVVAVTMYLVAVARLRRRGDRWPVPRTTLWVLGWAVLAYATSGAPTVYGRVLFSMHMVEHMTIGTLVPILLVLGAPVTLVLRAAVARRDGSRGLREWTLVLVHSRLFRALAHPVVAPASFVGSLIVFYYTPLLQLSLSTHVGHVLMTTHFILVGYLFAWVICGPDPGPSRPQYPIRMLVLIATMAFHAFFGIAMMSSEEVLAAGWFSSLDRPWGPSLIEDQRRGGAMAWGLGDYPVAVLAVAMAVAWIRDDERETRRYDRRADRDGDAELQAWNAMLQQRQMWHDAENPTRRDL